MKKQYFISRVFTKKSHTNHIKKGAACLVLLSLLSLPSFSQTISWTGCTGSTPNTSGDAVVAFNNNSCDVNAAGFTSETIGNNTVRVAFGAIAGNSYLRNDISSGGSFSYGRFYTSDHSTFALGSATLVAITTNVSQTVTLSAYHNNTLMGAVTKSFTSGGSSTLPVSSSDLGNNFVNIDEIRTTTSCSTCNGVGLDDIVFTSSPLALDLISFTGNHSASHNTLSWVTVNESDMSGFIIEKSLDGIHFNSIGSLPARNQKEQQQYSFIDKSAPAATVAYYRLKIAQLSGNYKYSSVVILKNNEDKETYAIYPNPAKDLLYVKLPTSVTGIIQISVMESNGKVILKSQEEFSIVSHTGLNISLLPVGLYFVQIKDDKGTILKTLKFQKG